MNQPVNSQIKEMLEVVDGIKETIGLSGAEAFNFYRQAVIGTEEDKSIEKKIEQLTNEMEEFRKLVLDKLDKLDGKNTTVDLNRYTWDSLSDSMMGGRNETDKSTTTNKCDILTKAQELAEQFSKSLIQTLDSYIEFAKQGNS